MGKIMNKIASFLALSLALVLLTGLADDQKKAANFALKSADGNIVELSRYHGKVVVLNFWATWCGPCRSEIPDFIELYEKYKNQGLEFIGVALDVDGWQSVTPYVKQTGITYPIVLPDDKIVGNYGNFNAIPTTFVIDARGTIIFQQTGMMSKARLEAKIKPLLKKRT